ncbi:hypothetical protein HYU14_05695 [Candidatus Woesearchaeota archaeon]|nr:hypothetical protein [Candidatus Woesearchaeota archaeon]
MTSLIVCLSSGKGTGAHALKVIEGMDWEKVFVVAPEEMKAEMPNIPKGEIIFISLQKSLSEMSDLIKACLKGKISDLEVALNIISGSGKEHMAVLKALMDLGIGIRLVALTKDGVKVL